MAALAKKLLTAQHAPPSSLLPTPQARLESCSVPATPSHKAASAVAAARATSQHFVQVAKATTQKKCLAKKRKIKRNGKKAQQEKREQQTRRTRQ